MLNRLQAYTHLLGTTKRRRDGLRQNLSDLYGSFVFLQTYVVLGGKF